MKRPIIFITNDDGYQAKGIHVLIEEMRKIGTVVAIAPRVGQSGMSHAITFKDPLRVRTLETAPDFSFYECSGTPVDCVKMGLDKFFKTLKPDLLVSGINHGSNASICSIYSGTVGAAREGAINGIPSIAFSLTDAHHDADFEPYRSHIQTIACAMIEQNSLNTNVFLNVNFPKVDSIGELQEIRICRQTKGVWIEEFDKRTDPQNIDYFWLTGHFDNYEPEVPDSDEYLLKQKHTTVVPLKIESTDMEALGVLQEMIATTSGK
ncbi:MAG: 5'/3'-nucleotidase SurE [Bacteroidales bacterium]|jgi:5'-nucleotidase|nr:5'/3'-nucleotidase SurE [Bacteroidales bacterium]